MLKISIVARRPLPDAMITGVQRSPIVATPMNIAGEKRRSIE
ncbi:hypothetical protein [Mycobacterium sp. 1081908.1]|nr:hypothetical protein [Mycobacterium sp. 1081908.1]